MRCLNGGWASLYSYPSYLVQDRREYGVTRRMCLLGMTECYVRAWKASRVERCCGGAAVGHGCARSTCERREADQLTQGIPKSQSIAKVVRAGYEINDWYHDANVRLPGHRVPQDM
jgi:hypothetical protein